jgi:KTSC domain
MKRTPVDSSFIASIGHDPESDTLHVEMLNGKVYEYRGVPAEEHAALMHSDSIGRQFGRRIRGRYEARPVE